MPQNHEVEGHPILPWKGISYPGRKTKGRFSAVPQDSTRGTEPLGSQKHYMGVQVRMPVRDMLRRIRIAKGLDIQDNTGKRSPGEKKRVKPKKQSWKMTSKKQSLEDLAIIVEVLEEDLRATGAHRAPHNLHHDKLEPPELSSRSSTPSCTDLTDITWSPTHSCTDPTDITWSPAHTYIDSSDALYGDLLDTEIYSGETFFQLQLHREEAILHHKSDDELLAADHMGRTMLHTAVIQARRGQACAIASRMSLHHQLDVKDAEGKTALHLAAERNHHLLVSDLLLLGADVNLRDKMGQTCIHLSARSGYVRVLEVLRDAARFGLTLDVDVADASGMTAAQLTAEALSTTLQMLHSCTDPGRLRLLTLYREQLCDTLELLLGMSNTNVAKGGQGDAEHHAS